MDDGSDGATFRRQVLAGGAGVVAGLLAGCIADSNSSNSGDSNDTEGSDTANGEEASPSWVRWSPAPGGEDTSMARAVHIDLEAVRESFPSDVVASGSRADLRDQLGLQEGAIHSQTIVTFASGAETAVVEGDINASTVKDTGAAQTSTYGEYDILGGDVAVREGVVILGPLYEPIIDAHAGDADTLGGAGGQWQSAIDRVGTAPIASLAHTPDRPWSISAISIQPTDSEAVRMTTTMYFDSAEAASENRQQASDSLPPEMSSDVTWEIQSTSVEDARVVVEATSADFRL